MSKLSDLKTAAASKLATVHEDVTAYISALETRVSQNKWWVVAVVVAGGAILWIAHKL